MTVISKVEHPLSKYLNEHNDKANVKKNVFVCYGDSIKDKRLVIANVNWPIRIY